MFSHKWQHDSFFFDGVALNQCFNYVFVRKSNYNHAVFDCSLLHSTVRKKAPMLISIPSSLPIWCRSKRSWTWTSVTWHGEFSKLLNAFCYWLSSKSGKGGREENICIYIFAYFNPFTAHFSLQTISYLQLFEGSNWQQLQWDFFL